MHFQKYAFMNPLAMCDSTDKCSFAYNFNSLLFCLNFHDRDGKKDGRMIIVYFLLQSTTLTNLTSFKFCSSR